MAASLEFRLTGGASNTDPDLSLGGVMSSQQISATPLNNLFDNVEPSEASSGDVEYRAIDIYNSGDAAAILVELYIDDAPDSPSVTIAVALDSTTQTTADEDTAPSGVSFSVPVEASKLSISDIASGGSQRVWIRRTVAASATNHANDTCGITVQYA